MGDRQHGVRLAVQQPDDGAVHATAARDAGVQGRPARVPEPARAELRRARSARRRCVEQHPSRPASKGTRRVAPRPDRRPAGVTAGKRRMTPYADPFATQERVALRALVRQFTEQEIVPYLEEWEHVGEVPRDLHKKAAATGLLGIGYPEAVGGGG